MNSYVIFRTALCPSCRLRGYGVMHGYITRDFKPCMECEKAIERILAMEVMEVTKL